MKMRSWMGIIGLASFSLLGCHDSGSDSSGISSNRPMSEVPAMDRDYDVVDDFTSIPRFVIHSPADLSSIPYKLPIIMASTSGGCPTENDRQTWEQAASKFNRPTASKGFFVAAFGLPADIQSTEMETPEMMREGFERVIALNRDKNSPYYQRLDESRVGAWGICCGASNIWGWLEAESRVHSMLAWAQSGSAGDVPLSFKGPISWFTGQYSDFISRPVSDSDFSAVPDSVPALLWSHLYADHVGMGVTVLTHEYVVNWFDFTLNGNPVARDWFLANPVGPCVGHEVCEWERTLSKNFGSSK